MAINNFILERWDLIRTFNKLKSKRIIAISAPAGYGKTVAVTQWLDKDKRAKAFLTVDEYDNKIASFCERFCEALCACQSQNKALKHIVSDPGFQSAPEEFSMRAISALAGRKHAVLAIDDLHEIYNKEVLKFLLHCINRLPKTFHVILISRYDLPSGFSDLWLKGHIVSISPKQFLFSNAEVKALYDIRGRQIGQKMAEDIGEKTKGWAIGINAFLLSGKESFDKAYVYLDDFIRANVWERLDDITRDFMLRTAGLRELTAAICAEMTGMVHSYKFLKELVQKGAFITQTQDDVFHYHQLFRQFLRRKMEERGEAFVYSLLEKEGDWHLSQCDFYSAIDCFIRCKNHEGIDRCYNLLETTHSNFVMERILPICKNQEVQLASKKYPRLVFLILWCAYVEGRVNDALSLMDEYYGRWSEIAAEYPESANNIIYTQILDFRVPLDCLSLIAEISAKHKADYLLRPASLSLSMHMPQLYRGIVDLSKLALGDVVENLRLLVKKAAWLYGDITDMMGAIVISGLLYEQGHLESAHKHALIALSEMKSHFPPELKFCAISALFMSLESLEGKGSEEAAQRLDSISRMIEDEEAYYLNRNFKAYAVRSQLATGSTKAAIEWLEEHGLEEPTLWGMYTAFTTCRAYMAMGKYDSAIILLKKNLAIANAFKRPLDILEANILLAIAYWKKKRLYQKEALIYLEAAVTTAFPYAYVQMFVNEAAPLAGMLWKLKKSVEYRQKMDENIISFIKMLYLKTRPLSNIMDISLAEDRKGKAVKLTDKQRAVMVLLCQGKRYKEVAESLGIKQSTVISHIELIYNKLDVTNLADCVAKVNAMGLLRHN